MVAGMGEDLWAGLADQFADGAYATVKGQVRTAVVHEQLLGHLPGPPGTVLDIGGGAGHQSFPLALGGYEVTVLDPSVAMLDKARDRLERLAQAGRVDAATRARLSFVHAPGEEAGRAVEGRRYDAVLCHGVLGYLEDPEPVLDQACERVVPGGLVSLLVGNAHAMAVRPALERRWADALAAFDSDREVGVLGLDTRADTVEDLGEQLRERGVDPVAWYGVWHFVDWLDLAGVALDPADREQLDEVVGVELEAGRRDPYRQLSRLVHLVGRRRPEAA